MDFCLLLKILVKVLVKILVINTVKNLWIILKQSATDVFKTALKRAIQKTAGATGNLIGKKIADVEAKSQ